jgi:dihydrolipoamide dehydrogenase
MTIVSPNATEMITQGSIGIQFEMEIEKLSECIFPHPTLSEAIGESLEGLEDKSIHI